VGAWACVTIDVGLLLQPGVSLKCQASELVGSNTCPRPTTQAECAEALARAGCDVGSKTLEGFTGPQLAEAQGSKEAVRRGSWARVTIDELRRMAPQAC
jgi:hypothetical protein